jgi:hypothetical protein
MWMWVNVKKRSNFGKNFSLQLNINTYFANIQGNFQKNGFFFTFYRRGKSGVKKRAVIGGNSLRIRGSKSI